MIHLCADTFFRDFKNAATEIYWKEYHDNTEWTTRVTQIIKTIIKNYDDLTAQTEYFRIDVVGWITRSEEVEREANDLGLRPHLWDLKIAVEHENNQKDWTDELVKLAHIRCPLKVVIGYIPCDQRGMQKLEGQRLAFAAKLLRQVEAFRASSGEEFLLIFGNSSAKDANYETFDYRGYLFDYAVNQFLPLSPEKKEVNK